MVRLISQYSTLVYSVAVLLWTAAAAYCFHFMAYQTDTPSFVHAIQLLVGDDNQVDRLFRLSKPLALLFPAFLHRTFSCPISTALFIQQYLACLACSYSIYLILSELVKRSTLARLGGFALLCCQAMAVYGLAMLTDAVGWCWMLMGIYASLRILPRFHTPSLLALGSWFGLGLFVKESILIAGLLAACYILLAPQHTWLKKLQMYALIGSSFGLVVLLGLGLTQAIWGYSLLDWLQFGHDTPPAFHFKNFLLQSYRTLDVCWILVGLGLVKTLPQWSTWPLAWRAFLLTAVLGWCLLPIAWPYWYDRILFLLVPFLMPWLVLGLSLFGKKAWLLCLWAGLLNLGAAYGIYYYQVPHLLSLALVLFLAACLFLYYNNRTVAF